MTRILLASLLLLAGVAVAQPAPPALRLRGTIERVGATSLLVRGRDGEATRLRLADDLRVTEVLPIDPAALQTGAFVGTTAVPGADGSLSAVEVHVLPESARGAGEGHRPSDLQTGSTMTNATVTAITPGTNARTITLRYKGGEQKIRVPDGVPIVTLRAGDRSLLVAGAKLIVTGQTLNDGAVASRIIVGRDGLTPPM